MLREIRAYIATHTILIAINIMVVSFISSLYIYDHFKVEQRFIVLGELVHQEVINRKCGDAANRLLQKIANTSNPEAIPNQEVSQDMLVEYKIALDLAFKDDIRCLIFENTGDAMLVAYKAGYKDGISKNDHSRGA
jgi:hypothetical protein